MQKKRCRLIFMPEGVFCSHCNFPAEQAQVAAVALSLEIKKKIAFVLFLFWDSFRYLYFILYK